MENGKRVYYGKGPRIGRHAVGTAQQVEIANEYGQRMAIEAGRPLHHCFMNIECLLEGKEDCRDHILEERGSWHRAEAFNRGILKARAS